MGNDIEYGMVDLGLPSGLKWADRNVGAESIEDYGDYFMWGSVTPDTDNVCDWAHATFNGGVTYFDEAYFNEHKSEWFADDGTLKPEYDAAHAIMGVSWRMPTQEEMHELVGGTTLSVEEVNGVKGMRFISKVNGNSIFMPFAGRRCGYGVDYVGIYGYAWSSSLYEDYALNSPSLSFRNYECAGVYFRHRCGGFVVRGVCH